IPADVEITKSTHRLIARVTEDYERWSYNTAVAACMEFVNQLYRYVQGDQPPRQATVDFALDQLLLLMAPMTPHVTAELWARRHDGDHIHERPWPVADPALAALETVTMVVQVNGKVRDRIEVPAATTDDEAVAMALASAKVQAFLAGAEPKKVIPRAPKLVNVVV
ncbi:MAG: class I tRNA ligase family protein, partial [Acidimicrobiales bacterium]|nr:class I tRNA ligase family protein [Acidimicrobiales bacterium]